MNKYEPLELETAEELRLAIHTVKQRADACGDDVEDDHCEEDDGGMAECYTHPLDAACRILRKCKQAHMNAYGLYIGEARRLITERMADQAAAEFRRRQQAAHSAVAAAVVSGALVRSSQCERCPTVADNTIAHHHDYDQPLDIEWLCRPCHGKHHAENGSAV